MKWYQYSKTIKCERCNSILHTSIENKFTSLFSCTFTQEIKPCKNCIDNDVNEYIKNYRTDVLETIRYLKK